jgi:hypothetical protein
VSCPEGEPVNTRAVVFAAATCAAAVLASQLAGKAARDAIFLQRFPVTNLPLLLAVSSALAIGTTFMFARRLARGVPARVVQLANVSSAVVLVIEWLLLDHFPRPVATVLYMHQTLLGPILVSGFWSIVSECFDPRTARRVVGSIGTGATVGGFLGAVLAERVAALAGTSALLPTIAALQLFATWRLGVFARNGSAVVAVDDGEPPPPIKEVALKITRVSLLRRLAVITVTVTIAAALLDYVFKEAVTQEVARSDDLARVFATFHGIVGVITAVAAWVLGRRALRSWGLARTLAMLPGSVIAFGSIALVAPGLGAFVALRGAENVVRNSLYREAYEVFYTPLLARERRATKTIIDVGVERFGDLLGGLAVLAILALTTDSTPVLLAGSIALSVLGVVIALKAQRSYVEALERSLLEHAIDIPNYEAHDRTTRTTLELIAQRSSKQPPSKRPFDSEMHRLAELQSGNTQRIRGALSGSLSPVMVAAAIPLLARTDVADDVARALAGAAVSCLGQLIDAARDPNLTLEVRVRLPELIASSGGELARVGLLGCLGDREPEVRFRAAEALLQLREHHPELDVDQSAVFAGVRRELEAEPEIWKALDSAPPLAVNEGNGVPSRAAQHLATLLALALPSEPVKTAFHGLWSEDVAFRGVALEYLDNVLPNDIRERIWLLLAIEAPALAARRPVEDVRAELLRSHERRAVVS